MSKIKRRKIPGHLQKVTCHYCQRFYESKIRQTGGEFVTRYSKGKKVKVSGNVIWRFCPSVRAFTTMDDLVCSEENFELSELFYCDKTNCWLTPGITCYFRRARGYPDCRKCRQFDQTIDKITETPSASTLKRKKKIAYTPANPYRVSTADTQTAENSPPKQKIKRRRVVSSPETQTISRKRKLKRRR